MSQDGIASGSDSCTFCWDATQETCPYLRRRCCLFFHPEDESASVSGVGQDLPSFASLMARIARLELEVAQFVGVPVPQIMKDLVDGVQSAPQEPNQECRDSADAVRRQGCHDGYGHQQGGRSVCAVAATAPPVDVEDRGSPAQFLDGFAPPVVSQVTKHVEISLFKYMHRTSPFPRFRRKSTR